ncbi:hypothetical protein F511_09842 [Dorcoceras hygrometricum]|uniref:Uncharacterized protein n=1 Tax=Dorcoceras hygrometricum TaxID=472368 RepID=A0A2Z7C8R7_9LAMI|nr:hypothetical protein F511_09842 [Dorcoceras hygrometricum]
MPPRRMGRGRGQFQEESEGQNEEVQRSVPRRGCDRQVEIEVDELAARVDDMELVMARFQRMNTQMFNGDESSFDTESWLQQGCLTVSATLDLPMVVDLIGIYVLKGPYYLSDLIVDRDYDEATVIDLNRMLGLQTQQLYTPNPRALAAPLPPFSLTAVAHLAPPPAAVRCRRGWTCSYHLDEEIPSVINSSRFLVQTDEGVEFSVVDRIRRTTIAYRRSADFLVKSVGARRLNSSKLHAASAIVRTVAASSARLLAGHRAQMSHTVLRDACRPPASALRAGGRPCAHAWRTGARAACGGAPPCSDSEAALRQLF